MRSAAGACRRCQSQAGADELCCWAVEPDGHVGPWPCGAERDQIGRSCRAGDGHRRCCRLSSCYFCQGAEIHRRCRDAAGLEDVDLGRHRAGFAGRKGGRRHQNQCAKRISNN